MFSIKLPPLRPSKKCIRNLNSNLTPIKMAYKVYEGSNTDKSLPPLIVMHGLLGSKRNWKRICRELQTKIKKRIYAVDARNHGDSPHTNEHSPANMAEDVAELIRQEGYKKASVIGHCMGGRSMMHFALQHPDLVECSIIVDISPFSVLQTKVEKLMLTMKNIKISKDLCIADGRKFVEEELKAVTNWNTLSFITLNLRKHKSGEFYWIYNLDALIHNFQQFTKSLEHEEETKPSTKPILFVCGNHSVSVDPETWPDIQKIFPNSILLWLEAGHMVHMDQPEMFINLVTKFLNTQV